LKLLVPISALCLAAGIGLFFGYCQGTTGVSLAYPLSAASIHIDATTTGIPALLSIALVPLGAVLLLVACLLALFSRSRAQSREFAEPRRREGPFQE
jgi:TRAP-type C4-dicarboxylate transport system permease small subunit